jgi:4-oxalocrotonate tautomerase
VPTASLTDHGRLNPFGKGNSMTLIQVKVIEGVFTAPQKREIVERLTDAMVAIEGENMRRHIWCVIEEVPSGDWAIGGHALTADDVRALGRDGNNAPSPGLG